MKLFAFWKYDLFPYLLGAKVEQVRDDGWVTTEGYQGMVFNPVRVLGGKTGEKLHAELKELTAEYDADLKKLRDEYLDRVNVRLAEYNVPPVGGR